MRQRHTGQNAGQSPPDPQKAAIIVIAGISLLIVLKLIASFITGSVGIRADAIHSVIDLSGAVIGLVGIKLASRPPDGDHAYGHSKIENIAGALIAAVIFLAAGTIAYEAVSRLLGGVVVKMPLVGVVVTALAIVINTGISRYALRTARSADSVALEATARDMIADVMSSAAVLAGLVLVSITGYAVLDPIAALFVAALIIRAACITMKNSVSDLLDTSLPPEELEQISRIISGHGDRVAGWHKLRTRKAGPERFIEIHLLFPRFTNIEEAHAVADKIQNEIQTVLSPSQVNIHIEPCDDNCEDCSITCDQEKE
jgi:cation diffusion facilitator family transporter